MHPTFRSFVDYVFVFAIFAAAASWGPRLGGSVGPADSRRKKLKKQKKLVPGIDLVLVSGIDLVLVLGFDLAWCPGSILVGVRVRPRLVSGFDVVLVSRFEVQSTGGAKYVESPLSFPFESNGGIARQREAAHNMQRALAHASAR